MRVYEEAEAVVRVSLAAEVGAEYRCCDRPGAGPNVEAAEMPVCSAAV